MLMAVVQRRDLPISVRARDVCDTVAMPPSPLRFNVITARDTAPEYRSLLASRNGEGEDETQRAKKKDAQQNGGPSACVITIILIVLLVAAIGVPLAIVQGQSSSSSSSSLTTTTASAPSTTTVPAPPMATGGSSGTPNVDVSVVCNAALPDGLCLGIFSYDNPSGEAFDVPVGANNDMTPEPLETSQPTHFVSGTRFGAVTAEWNCTQHSSLSWLVRSGDGVSVATTSAAVTACPSLHSLIN